MTDDRPATKSITTKQLRQLHALLRDHGITGDRAIHDYIGLALEEAGGAPVESRKDLTQVAAAKLITDLEQTDVVHAPTAGARDLRKLREPFPPEAIGHLPRSTCRDCSQSQRKRCDRHQWITGCPQCHGSHSSATMHIDYVGHADVTARLLEVDPAWTWEPMALDPSGLPLIDRNGGLWIRLTVLGVTRPGYGDAEGGKGAKEAIGDALRNAAMRFGVALDLWAKGDREWSRAEKTDATTTHPDQAPPAEPAQPRTWNGQSTAELLLQIDTDSTNVGITYEQITAKMRADLDPFNAGGIPVEDLDNLDPWVIKPYADAIHAHAEKVVADRGATTS
jgi:hypothetical protein